MSQKNLHYILIVNSEPDVADLFAEMLMMDVEKYIINTAYSGKDCLLTMERERPDMILLEIELSDMDGWELVKKIKEIEPDMPVVVATAKLPRMDDISLLYMVSDYLMKPVTIDCLHMAVRDALEIPNLLDKCIETAKMSRGRTRYLLEKKVRLLKQNISDRKLFILMRQLYPHTKLKNDPDIRSKLDILRTKIEKEFNELEAFKKDCLFA